MDFWNDYEGKIIAGSYPLERLLHPEGRSGFFVTSNGTGTPAVIRLTESLNDQEEIFAQWQAVRDLKHPNLVTIRNYGHTVVDDAPLIYAVLEPADAELSDMLRERTMTVEETKEIAISVISVLRALHAKGLIHGHVEPSAVMAVGEVVKLRSDCVRKAPEGPEGESLRALDVKDLSILLLQSLTRQRNRHHLPLPSPFDQIIANGISGAWGLEEIASALNPTERRSAVSQPVPLPVERLVETPLPVVHTASKSVVDEIDDAILEELMDDSPAETGNRASVVPSGMGPWIAVALVLLAAIIAWYVFNPLTPEQRAISDSRPSAAAVSAPLPLPFAPKATASAAKPSAAPTPAAATPAAVTPVPATQPAVPQQSAAAPHEVWRVVVYTYNQQNRAEEKVAALRRKHNSMNPEVFTPTGAAPFLVTLGGAMTHDQALALKRKAHSQGLPRDVYAQNYTVQ